MTKIGSHSRSGKLAIVDGRSAEAQLMRRVRDDLAQHVGGRPSATQAINGVQSSRAIQIARDEGY